MVIKAMLSADGHEDKSEDVTALVQKCVSGGALQLKEFHPPDIAFGAHKTLLVVGSYAGTGFVLRLPEGGFGDFEFGRPVPRKRQVR